MACSYNCRKKHCQSLMAAVVLPAWMQLEFSRLMDVKSPVVYCQRGKTCSLVMCVLGHEVGKGLGITVSSFPDELFFDVYLLVLSPIAPTWFFCGCGQASKMVALHEKHGETLQNLYFLYGVVF